MGDALKIPHVYAAMIAVKKRMSEVGLTKSKTAPSAMGGYAFRGIDDLYNALCQVEAEENLLVFPRIISERTEYQTNDKGKIQTHVHITMEFKFVSAIDGSSDIASAIGEGIDSGDKASGKAQSNAMKFGHLEIYKIPTEGLSDDIEAHAEQVGKRVETSEPISLEQKQLEATLKWGAWESKVSTQLRKQRSAGGVNEVWTDAYPDVKRAPEANQKRLTAVRDECLKALRTNGNGAEAPR